MYTIKLSIKNLLAKEKHKFKKIEFKNFESEINLKNLKKYRKILKNKLTSIKFNFIKGKILLYENKNYIATLLAKLIQTLNFQIFLLKES